VYQTFRDYVAGILIDLDGVDSQLVFLVMLIIAAAIVLDAITMIARKKRREVGLDIKRAQPLSIDGSKSLPHRHYVSEKQGLAGKPDALTVEDGFIIPVERKPLAKKLRDRYVAQLLVYMRLIEEFEGKRPPYGYLILGPGARRVKIDNSERRQAWLQEILDQMRGILAGNATVATPHPKKCSRCDVREACAHRADIAIEVPRTPSISKIIQ